MGAAVPMRCWTFIWVGAVAQNPLERPLPEFSWCCRNLLFADQIENSHGSKLLAAVSVRFGYYLFCGIV
jgi:hypothetical protein